MKTVEDFMTKDVFSVGPQTPMRQVMEALLERKISGITVVDSKNELLGLVTEGDLLHSEKLTVSLLEGQEPLLKIDNEPIENIMKRKVVTITRDAALTKACGLINMYRFKRLVVVDENNRVVGILSRRDVIRAML